VLLSVRSVGREFQIVGAAWQNARLPKNSSGSSMVKQTMVAGAEMTWWRSE